MSDQQPEPVTERIPVPSLVGSPVVLPDLRHPAGPAHIAQPHTRARIRESRRPTHRDAASRLPPKLAGNWLALDMALLASSQPLSLSQTWAWHHSCADYYRGGQTLQGLRWPRLAWACLVLAVVMVIHTVIWWTASPVRALPTAGLIALLVWLL